MPKRAKELGTKALEAAIRRAGDGPKLIAVGGAIGLHLQVRPGTEPGRPATSWIFRYQAGVTPDGKPKRRDHGLGGYPDVPLSEARQRANALRAQLRQGLDPIESRRAEKFKVSAILTFDEAARRLIEAKAPEWRNAKHREQWRSTLATYASPVLGRMPVDAIEQRHILDVLAPIWTIKTETASRVRARIEAVLGWATVSGYRTGDNPARWRHHLDKVLPKPTKVRKVKHHPAMPIDAMPTFMAALRGRSGIAARALEFAILTAARSGEVRGARWGEIDLDAALWAVPAVRMKAGKEHKVPLSPQAIALLRRLPRLEETDLVFPSPRGKVLSDTTLSAVLRRMGVDVVPHGFRSTFRDWAAERTSYPREVAEMALAHAISNKVEAAYRRGELLAKRARMMNDWARFLDTPLAASYHGGRYTDSPQGVKVPEPRALTRGPASTTATVRESRSWQLQL